MERKLPLEGYKAKLSWKIRTCSREVGDVRGFSDDYGDGLLRLSEPQKYALETTRGGFKFC